MQQRSASESISDSESGSEGSESENNGYTCVYCLHVTVCRNNFCPHCGASTATLSPAPVLPPGWRPMYRTHGGRTMRQNVEARAAERAADPESDAETEAWSSDGEESSEEASNPPSFVPDSRRRTRETAFGTPQSDPVPEVMPSRPSMSRAQPIPGPWLTSRHLPQASDPEPEPRAKRPSIVDLTCEECPVCDEVCTYLINCGQCSQGICSACWARVSRCPFCRVAIK